MISKILPIVFGLVISFNIYCQENIDSSKCNLETIKNLRIHKDSITDNDEIAIKILDAIKLAAKRLKIK